MIEKTFPTQDGPDIPWGLIEPHTGQVMENHGQTLERLVERNGLSSMEAVAALNDKDLRWMLNQERIGRTGYHMKELCRKIQDYRKSDIDPLLKDAEICARFSKFRALDEETKLAAARIIAATKGGAGG